MSLLSRAKRSTASTSTSHDDELRGYVAALSDVAEKLGAATSTDQAITVAMDSVEFKKGVREGTILRFTVDNCRKGRTSVTWEVRVWREQEEIFSNHVTLVRIDENGEKTTLPS